MGAPGTLPHAHAPGCAATALSAPLAAVVQAATGETVTLAYVDAGYTGEEPRQAAAAEGIALEVIKLPALQRGVVLLRPWVVERDFAWLSRFRGLVRDQERLAEAVKGFGLIAVITLMSKPILPVLDLLRRPEQALGAPFSVKPCAPFAPSHACLAVRSLSSISQA